MLILDSNTEVENMPAMIFIPHNIRPWDAVTTHEFIHTMGWVLLGVVTFILLVMLIACLFAPKEGSYVRRRRARPRNFYRRR